MRIDQALVEGNFFKTRTKAKEAVLAGVVFFAGKKVEKPSLDVSDSSLLQIKGKIMPYVSRGGLKLEKALCQFDIDLRGKIVLDIGSSTGGFTDCALKNGAKEVIAVDVGTDQLDASLRDSPNIMLYEQTDFRDIDLAFIQKAQFITIDVSFISVKKLLEKLNQLSALEGIICLIKPQFECGKEIADKYHGIIKNAQIHQNILEDVISSFSKYQFYCQGLTFSPITGGSGNREYLAYFTKIQTNYHPSIKEIVNQAFQQL